MKKNRFYPILLLIPLFIIVWGIFYFNLYDTFYSRNVDPEYPYLINGLNVALLEFNRIGHFDHPGTPFQVYCGLIIRITHLFTGKDSIAQDVFNRPDYYLTAINYSLVILQSLLCFFIAFVGRKREIKIWQIILLQSGVLFNVLMLTLFNRVIPERWFMVIALLFIIAYLLYGYKDKHPLKFAIASGVIMGMGLATKFNFLPILFLPFLLINSNKNRLVYAATGIASFFLFLLPIIKKFGDYRDFIKSIATHDGIYGQGAERMFDLERLRTGFIQVFESAPELIFVIFAIIAALFFAILYRKKEKTNREILFFSGFLFIVLFQILMVSKHFKNTYLIPLITFYPIFLFLFDNFMHKIGTGKKWSLLPAILLFIICIGYTSTRLIENEKYREYWITQRESLRTYVSENLPKNALWFVEPTWESAPYVENGIVYGLCYSHCNKKYIYELIHKNPNILSYKDSKVLIWQRYEVLIDSLVVTNTPIHLYSSPGRNAETLMEILESAAQRNGVTFTTDTLFSNSELRSHIIVMQNKQSEQNWKTENYASREAEIQYFIKSIYGTPEWLEVVKEKALDQNIPLDSMVLLDAIYMTDNQ
ncbi:MAG: glycosyltransferase 87 family protein [Bacteroidales bacterium]|jgi:4-amino-4-deoxy-L-arabinose transferase-like glycosyltransferase|nr:glycosyltransferase 87 family protein [Bacteroidales bacterium]